MRPDLILFTPGPVRIPSLVAEYLAHPPCNYHRQDAFSRMFSETEQSLKKLVGIKNADAYFATILTATGTGANEGCIYALEPLGKGLLLSNGFFGARVIDQARQAGVNFTALESAQDKPIDVDAVVKAIESDQDIKWLWFVSHETRTGLKNPFEAIGSAAKARGLYVAADLISSAYAYPIDIEASGVDLVTASSAKAIQAAPGLGIVFTKKASVAALSAKPRSYYLDVIAEYKKQSAELQPRFAQPVALHAALRAACMHLEKSGGIDAHFTRIQRQMQALIDHLAPIGVHPLLDETYRSNIAVNFRLPVGMPYSDFSRRMEEQGYFCLYGIPGDQSHFQLSTIGDLDDSHIAGVKQALSRVFGR
ncbi:MAG: aminotransferase class V-fold PLP-dependent enzyme [Myxococcota bacterium]|nr:alanine--glyoxylate aminotransferase family protein [Deltaproteobacteria bacterium]MDQ3334630.1 aminotransferase class V-fold PLP-dependent enzyme [Myxococcota bacterium]